MPKAPRIPKAQAERIHQRARGRCERCGKWTGQLQIHHKVSKGMGGRKHVYEDSELAAECGWCHGTSRVGGRPTDAQVQKWREGEGKRLSHENRRR